jgi:hypothetical protein
MSVQSIQSSQAVAQTQAVSQAQSAQRQTSTQRALPEDKVTISAAAQAKQTASSIGADVDHDGDSK